MPIFDTFETESASAYSGSYISNYYAYLDSTVDNNGFRPAGEKIGLFTNAGKRGKIFDISSREVSNFYPEVTFDGEKYFKLINKNTNILGRVEKFVSIFTDNEFYFDSIMPRPYDIHLSNGAQSVYSAFATTLLGGNVGHTLPLTIGAELTASNNFTNIGDKKWFYSFPFSYKYKNLSRFLTQTKIDEEISYYSSGAFGSLVAKKNVEWQVWKYGTGINPEILPNPIRTNTPQFLVVWLVPSQSFPNGVLSQPDSSFSTDRKLNNTFISPWNYKYKNNTLTSAIENISTEDQLNSYFGFGNSSPFKLPSYLAYIPWLGLSPILTGSNNQSTLYLGTGMILRGYKYGVYSANLSKTKSIFRVGKYGQFRDTLEQRQFTQILNTERIITKKLFPIDISFVSGTTIYSQAIDYVSSTNPTYNPYDSGIYDYHYRSGQPFTDR